MTKQQGDVESPTQATKTTNADGGRAPQAEQSTGAIAKVTRDVPEPSLYEKLKHMY